MRNAIVDVPGLKVGHDTDLEGATGCTVVLCEAGAVAGVAVRGGAPGTRETDLLRPEATVPTVHAVLLTGGSAFGLEAAAGVMRYLEERGVGYPTRAGPVPIVPAAVLFDLPLGDRQRRPDAAAGYRACCAAHAGEASEGNVGAGTGATVGKLRGMSRAMKGGIGTASASLGQGVVVGVLVAVNAFGNVCDPQSGAVIAGARGDDGRPGVTTLVDLAPLDQAPLENTTLVVVATNAVLDKAGATALAGMAHDGLARAIQPAHTPVDGDTVFALATGHVAAPALLQLGAMAADLVATAVVRAVRAARSLHGVPGLADWQGATDD